MKVLRKQCSQRSNSRTNGVVKLKFYPWRGYGR